MHVYFGIESLSLTAPQRQTLVAALRALGKQADPQPCRINHWRPRLDNLAAIFEAEFAASEIAADAFRQYIAAVFGVPVAQVTAATASTQYGPVVTLRYNSIDRLRAILFGGVGASWETSRQAALAYLAANTVEWEG